MDKRPPRKTFFAAIAVVAGLALVGLELARPGGTSAGERWFWLVVGVLLVALGLAELMSGRGGGGDEVGPDG